MRLRWPRRLEVGSPEEFMFAPDSPPEGGGFELRSGLSAGGKWIRTIGPASGKVVDAKFQRSDPAGRTLGRRC